MVLLYGVSLLVGSCERQYHTGMAVNHTPILTYGGDKNLQSIKKKKKIDLFQLFYNN